LDQIVSELVANDVQVYTHALGDGGVRAVLNAFEQAQKNHGSKDLRHQSFPHAVNPSR